MWFGKVGMIMAIWYMSLLFFGYYVGSIFPTSIYATNPHYTYNSLKTIADSFSGINDSVNTSLIFGDFIAGLTVMKGLFLGAPITDALLGLPFVNTAILLEIQIIYVISEIALWVYIIANRSI